MRRSIAGPLFIIIIGSLLLAQNLLADFSIWQLFALHWPWLLIGWGGFRLLEHGLSAARGESGPSPMGGGALAAAVLLCCAGSAAHAVQKAKWTDGIELLWSGLKALETTHDVGMSESWPATGIETLEIDGYLGELTLAGTDEGFIRLEGKRVIVADNEAAARKASQTAPVMFEVVENTAILSPSGGPARRFSGDLVVRAPKSLQLVVRKGDGDLKIRDFDSSAAIEAAREVDVERVAGPVTVKLRRGRRVEAKEVAGDFTLTGSARSVELEGIGGAVSLDGDLFGKLNVEATGPFDLSSRRLKLKTPGGLPGTLDTNHRSIAIDGVSGGLDLTATGRWRIHASAFGGPSRLIGQRGSIEAEMDSDHLADLEMKIDSGDITLGLPTDGDYVLEAEATLVESSLPDQQATADGSLSLGSGEPRLRLKTGRGRIRIKPLD